MSMVRDYIVQGPPCQFTPFPPRPATAGPYTPQDPPYPTVTRSPSTMVGTFRLPWEYRSISSSRDGSFLTSTYSALFPKASRAFSV